jgi:hypothetical protein
VIIYALPRGRVFMFSHLGFTIRRYFAERDILRAATAFLGSPLQVPSPDIGIRKFDFRMTSFAHGQISFAVKKSTLVQFKFRGKWFHIFVPISGTVFNLISFIQCDCRIERDSRLLYKDSVLVDSLQIKDTFSNLIHLCIGETGGWSSDRANVDIQLSP